MLAPPTSMPAQSLDHAFYVPSGMTPSSSFASDETVSAAPSHSVAVFPRRPSVPSPRGTSAALEVLPALAPTTPETAPHNIKRNRIRQGSLHRLHTHPPYSPRREEETHEEQRERFGTPKDAWIWSAMDSMLDGSPTVDLTEGHQALIKSPSAVDLYKSKTGPGDRSPAEGGSLGFSPLPATYHGADPVATRRHSSAEALLNVGLGIAVAEGLARTISNVSSEGSVGSMTSGSTGSSGSASHSPWVPSYRVTIEEEEDVDQPRKAYDAGDVDPLAPGPAPVFASSTSTRPRPTHRNSSVSSASFIHLTPSVHEGWEERDGWIQLGRAKGKDMEARMLLLSEEQGSPRRASMAATMSGNPTAGSSEPEENWKRLPRKTIDRLMRAE